METVGQVEEPVARARLGRREPVSSGVGSSRAAAVALVLFARGHGPATRTVITRRSSRLRAHPGQWALPGGRLEPGETPEQAALREVSEEIGVRADQATALGRLDDYTTASGFHITPVVLWSTQDPATLVADPAEVASIHVLEVAELDVAAVFVEDPDLPTPVLRFPFRGRHIHAPTGAFLFQFRELLLHGRDTPVHHYSSPTWLNRPKGTTD